MRIVVTGSAGIVGRMTMAALSGHHDVVGVDRLVGHTVHDVVDLAAAGPASLEAVLDGAEVLVHLAADANPSSPDESILHNNVGASTRLLRAAVAAGVRRLVLASSQLVQVGIESLRPEGELIAVDDRLLGTSLYGISKMWIEHLGAMLHNEHGTEVIACRLGTVIEDDREHWRRGGRLMATCFLCQDVQAFMQAACEVDVPGGWLVTTAQSDPPTRFHDLDPGLSVLGWTPATWDDDPDIVLGAGS